ncbi:MAG: nucleotidyltransferase domain-containing protein [Cellulosilyticaceae bacterium]
MQDVLRKICEVAKQIDEIECIKLFGSRARGDHRNTSDIDLAVFGEHIDKEHFTYEIETRVATLLEFDISYMEEIEDVVFKEQVEREGIVIYEKRRL